MKEKIIAYYESEAERCLAEIRMAVLRKDYGSAEIAKEKYKLIRKKLAELDG